jgi:pimeloyl-ACP methyl ester carboxylesterase
VVRAVREKTDAAASIVFIHGLDGDCERSWGFGRDDNWADWIEAARIDADVWSVCYANAAWRWRGGALPLYDRAGEVLALLSAKGVFNKPFLLVVHSMGGLLVKQMARLAEDTRQYHAAFDNCAGIVFLATPHTGSDLASLATFLGFYAGANVSLRELQREAPAMRDLNLWFRGYIERRGLPVTVCRETQKTGPVMVVDLASSDPGLVGVVPISIECNHIEISRPGSSEHPVAQIVLGSLRDFLAAGPIRLRDKSKGFNVVEGVRAGGDINIQQTFAPDKSGGFS